MDSKELATHEAMAQRAADVLLWYDQASSDDYAEELEFLDRARRFDEPQPMLRYDVQTSHAVATAVRDAVPFLQQTMGKPRAPFYRLVGGIPQFHDGPVGEAYHDALVRLKAHLERMARE